MRRPRTTTLAFSAVLALLATGGLAQPAAAAWTPTYKLTASGWESGDGESVDVDRDGDATHVWMANPEDGVLDRVQVRTRNSTGTLGPLLSISPSDEDANWPELAVDDDGDATVVWEQEGVIVGRRVIKTGQLTPLRVLSSSYDNWKTLPQVAVDPGGTALAVWNEYRGGPYVLMARHIFTDGSMSALMELGPTTGDRATVAMDRTGGAIVAWSTGTKILARRIRQGPSVGKLTTIISPTTTLKTFGLPKAAVDSDGDAVVTFLGHSDAGSKLYARRWSKAGAFGTPTVMSDPKHSVAFSHSVDSDLEGDVLVSWTRVKPGTEQYEGYARTMSRTGAKGTIAALGFADQPEVALDDDGDGIVVWKNGNGASTTPIGSRKVSRSGVWSSPPTLSDNGNAPDVAAQPRGSFAVVWVHRKYPYPIQSTMGS